MKMLKDSMWEIPSDMLAFVSGGDGPGTAAAVIGGSAAIGGGAAMSGIMTSGGSVGAAATAGAVGAATGAALGAAAVVGYAAGTAIYHAFDTQIQGVLEEIFG